MFGFFKEKRKPKDWGPIQKEVVLSDGTFLSIYPIKASYMIGLPDDEFAKILVLISRIIKLDDHEVTPLELSEMLLSKITEISLHIQK